MLPDYKVYVFYKEYYNSLSYTGWRKLSNLKDRDLVYCFYHNNGYYGHLNKKIIRLIKFKGTISIYKFREIEIKIPKHRIIFHRPKFSNTFLNYNNIEYQLILYLLSSSYNKKYLLVSEKIAIKLQKCLKYDFNFIYKNGKYIIKKIIPLDEIFHLIEKYFCFRYIYEIIYLNGSNKFYENISLIEFLCRRNGIEYEIYKNYIEIFVINQQELKHKRDIYFEGEIYGFNINDNLLYVKIGKYVLFVK